MDPWTAIVVGLVIIPAFGLVAVVADMIDAYREHIYASDFSDKGSVEYEQTRHDLMSQVSRSISLLLIALMATSSLADILNRNTLALLIYLLALVLMADAWRCRRARKRMLAKMYEERA